MQIDHHELHREFPEYVDLMHVLRTSDSYFCQMFNEYHNLTTQVEHLEEEDVPVDDFTIEEMKKKRAKLKDKMYKMLITHESQQLSRN